MHTSTAPQPFHISISLQQLVFTQGSMLGELIQRWNAERKRYQSLQKDNPKHLKQSLKDHSQLSIDISELLKINDQQKAVFIIELVQQQHRLCQSTCVAKLDTTQPTNKLYSYPINLTTIEIVSITELTSFVYDYSPMSDQQVVLRVSLQLSSSQKDKILIGQCLIDVNLFVEMFLDDGTQCIKDCKRLYKKINKQKQIDQSVDAILEVYIQRDRLSLQRVKINSKKGINVVDFKQQIKKIMREKKLINNNNEQYQQQQKSQQLANSQQQQSQTPQKTNYNNKSLSAKYHKYLQRNVQQRLKYLHPKKELIQNQVDTLMKERQQFLASQKSKKVSSSPQKRVQKANKKQQKHQQTNKESKKQSEQQKHNKLMQRLKILAFIIISAILLYLSMTPSRKVQSTYVPTVDQHM